jgi:hypothetical protein
MQHTQYGPRWGDLGDDQREYEFEPFGAPVEEPVLVPAPVEPVKVPVPA